MIRLSPQTDLLHIEHFLNGAEDDVVDAAGVAQVCEGVPLDLKQGEFEAPRQGLHRQPEAPGLTVTPQTQRTPALRASGPRIAFPPGPKAGIPCEDSEDGSEGAFRGLVLVLGEAGPADHGRQCGTEERQGDDDDDSRDEHDGVALLDDMSLGDAAGTVSAAASEMAPRIPAHASGRR
ncbi:hypothetical protein ACH40F_48215 [Streptomyces sp. NPDC020794]|uniref:hypothetical protein n=1 Tax=unclassified Streptomyces TaxID=2593676 RepID=UPI0036E5D83E